AGAALRRPELRVGPRARVHTQVQLVVAESCDPLGAGYVVDGHRPDARLAHPANLEVSTGGPMSTGCTRHDRGGRTHRRLGTMSPCVCSWPPTSSRAR